MTTVSFHNLQGGPPTWVCLFKHRFFAGSSFIADFMLIFGQLVR